MLVYCVRTKKKKRGQVVAVRFLMQVFIPGKPFDVGCCDTQRYEEPAEQVKQVKETANQEALW